MGDYYTDCDWCGAVTNNSQIVRLDGGHICREDAALLEAREMQSWLDVKAKFDALLAAVPYPHTYENLEGKYPGYYTYQPQRFVDPDAAVTGITSLMPTSRDLATNIISPLVYYPYFATAAEAVTYMKEHGVIGNVQRYQVTRNLIHRIKLLVTGGYDHEKGRAAGYEMENRPWLTSGIAAIVQPVNDGHVHISPMDMFSAEPPVIYDTATGKEIRLRPNPLPDAAYEIMEGDE